MEYQTILVVDDEEHILELIEYNLMLDGFSVLKATNGEKALALLQKEQVDLVLLDVMMEGLDGFEVLKRIRRMENLADLPVILLTAKSEEGDKVQGLELGADDYIAKPFSLRELTARIKAVLRRTGRKTAPQTSVGQSQDGVRKGKLIINKVTREVLANGQNVELALKEFELLYLLVKNKGIVYSRDQLLEKVWGYDYYGETRTVDVHIRNIRRKLEEKGMDPECIKTIRGVGYKFQMGE